MDKEKLEPIQDTETPQETVEETPQEAPKGRMAAIAMYKAKYPDKFAEGTEEPDDEELYNDLIKSHSEKEEEVGKLSEANDKYHANSMKLVDLIDANPDLAELFSTLNDDDEFLTSIKSRKENQKLIEANATETINNVMAWQEEEGVSEEERIQRVQFIVEIGENIDKGIIAKDIWDYAGKALNHDTNIEAAVVAGKNAVIDSKKVALKQDKDVFPDATPKSIPTTKPEYTEPEDNYNFASDLKPIKK